MRVSIGKKISIGLATIFFVIFGIPFIATLCSIAWVKLNSPPPLLQETADTTPVHVQLGGQDFLIPANYFNNGHPEYAKREQTAWIHAHWPDMSGSTKESIEHRKEYVGQLNRLTILIHGSPVTVDRGEARLKIYRKWSKSDDYKKFKNPQVRFGLVYHESVLEKPVGTIEDIYVDDPDHPLTMITCTGINEKKIPYPSCDQYFDYRNLRFEVNYAKKYLPEWKNIQNKVELLLNHFAEDYANTHPSTNQGDQP
jgi:hypothetical protein